MTASASLSRLAAAVAITAAFWLADASTGSAQVADGVTPADAGAAPTATPVPPTPTATSVPPTATPTTVRAAAAVQPAVITFLVAACPPESAIAVAVTAGRDPRSSDNGTAADPADIGAYGCRPSAGAYRLYLLASSTKVVAYTDAALATVAANNGNDDAWDGAASTVAPGESFYAPPGKSAARRFSVAEFKHPGSAWPGLPFLDLQCHTDGVNNDNGDGAGWDSGSFSAGQQVYCILYVVERTPEPTPTPTFTPTPTIASAPSPTPTSTPPDLVAGAVTKELHPDIKVDEANGIVTWIIRPLERGDRIYVWDAGADTCDAFGGARCGGVAGDGSPGQFNPGRGNDQHLIVTQRFEVSDGKCEPVVNTVEWSSSADAPPGKRETATAEYRCSGATALGWPLLALSGLAAIAVAGYVVRRSGW